jgi:hypothetical protein
MLVLHVSVCCFVSGLALGQISTLAGNGSQGFTGDGGLATSATLKYPYGVAVDSTTGSIFIADNYNHRRYGQTALLQRSPVRNHPDPVGTMGRLHLQAYITHLAWPLSPPQAAF